MGYGSTGPDERGKKTIETFRDWAKEAMDDERKNDIQLEVLDGVLKELAFKLPAVIGNTISDIFNEASHLAPEARNKRLIEAFTASESGTALTIPVGINTMYTQYYDSDIRQLPGYVKLHEVARELDFAIDLKGLTGAMGMPPKLALDLSKTYEEGEYESSCGYPDLPEQSQAVAALPSGTRAQKPKNGRYSM